MGSIRKIKAVWKYQTTLQIFDTKVLMVFVLLFLYVRNYTEPIVEFSKTVHEGISPYLFSLFMNDMVFPIIVALGYLLLICNAPFLNKGYLFLVARTGKLYWVIGEACFLFTYAVFYVFMLIGLTILNILPYISWEMEWGKIIMSLVRTDASVQFQTLELSPYVVENYSAIEALQKTVLLSVLFFWGIGMLVFAFNYAFQNFFGVVVAVVLIFFDLGIYNLFSSSMWYRFSPMSLMKLSIVSGVNVWNPTYEYAVIALSTIGVIFFCIIFVVAKYRKTIGVNDRRGN